MSPERRVDADLDRQSTSDSSAGFEAWYASNYDRLRTWCLRRVRDRATAEDIAQETLLRAWANRHRLGTDEDLSRWAWCVARNLCIDTARHRARVDVHPEPPQDPDPDLDPVAHVLREDERDSVRRALSGLSDHHRRALYLHDVDELDYAGVAEQLGISPSGARALLCRARHTLRTSLRTKQLLGLLPWPLIAARTMIDALRRRGMTTPAGPAAALSAGIAAVAIASLLLTPAPKEGLRLPVPAPETVEDGVEPVVDTRAGSPGEAPDPAPAADVLAAAPIVEETVEAIVGLLPREFEEEIPDPVSGIWRFRFGVGSSSIADTGPAQPYAELTRELDQHLLSHLLPCLDISLLEPSGPQPDSTGCDEQRSLGF